MTELSDAETADDREELAKVGARSRLLARPVIFAAVAVAVAVAALAVNQLRHDEHAAELDRQIDSNRARIRQLEQCVEDPECKTVPPAPTTSTAPPPPASRRPPAPTTTPRRRRPTTPRPTPTPTPTPTSTSSSTTKKPKPCPAPTAPAGPKPCPTVPPAP